jgi:hypothetical protein
MMKLLGAVSALVLLVATGAVDAQAQQQQQGPAAQQEREVPSVIQGQTSQQDQTAAKQGQTTIQGQQGGGACPPGQTCPGGQTTTDIGAAGQQGTTTGATPGGAVDTQSQGTGQGGG